MFQRDSSINPGPASNSIFSSRGKVVPVGAKPNLQGNNEHHESQKLTWEIEEGHSSRVKSQFLWDEVDANESADFGTDAEFTGSRRELLNLNKVIDKQMQWASGENSQIERLDSHRAPQPTSARGGSKTNHLYVIDDTDEGEEKKDSIGVMSGVSFSENGKSMVRPQALASDDQVKDKLFETIKRNKEYVATMKKLRKMYRSQLQKYNKLSEQLTNVQDELHAATHSAATGGASMFTAKINVNNVSAKEDEERARREKERKKLLQAGGDDGDYNDIFGVQEGTMNFFQIVRYQLNAS